MRILLALFTASALLVPCLPARAEEAPEPKPHTDEQLEEYEVFEKFEAGWKRDDIDVRMDALRRFGRWKHKKVLKRLKKIWLKEQEHELIAVAAEGLGHQTPFKKEAGKLLIKRLEDMEKWAIPEDDEDEETIRVRLEAAAVAAGIKALGALDYRDGWKETKGFLDHIDDEIAGEMMLLCGKFKEYRALPILLEWFNFYPDGHSWSGGSVSVDTGAAGTKDARAAKAKWKAKYGGQKRKARPAAWEKMVQSLEMITGEKFEKPGELKAWMRANKAFLKRQGM